MASSRRARHLLFAAVSVLFCATAVVIFLQGSPASPGEARLARKSPASRRSAVEVRRAERRIAALRASGEDLHDDEPVPPLGMERAGRRFLRFYLPYEVGRSSRTNAAGLRASASPGFAAELVRNAPRVPPAVGTEPPEAQLLGLDAFILDGDPGAGQIVAKLRRGGGLEAAAFELRRIGGRWVVIGVAG